MKVFKFGGASVKDANAVKNVASILSFYKDEKLGVVISAMGKTTNAMEKIIDAYWNKSKEEFTSLIEERRRFHIEIIDELFADSSLHIYEEVNDVLDGLLEYFDRKASGNYDFEYDQIVGLGEVMSTKIVSAYLSYNGMQSKWMDARKLIFTNDTFREAELDWEITTKNFKANFKPEFETVDILVTQGFVGSNNGATTTLGREGSDFTAGVIAYCCDAEDVTIWKDVPGMLNADPKWFDNTVKLDQISFREAIELSYYGASVIHPKTIKPLQNKEIPLYVKSFIDPHEDGTVIQSSMSKDHLVPSFIFKMNQILFSFTPKDFSFIVEKNLSDIFDRLSKANAKINLMQNSALNFSILLDEDKVNTEEILDLFGDHYYVKFNEGLELVTIRHYDQATLDRVTVDKDVVLQQKTRETARLIVKQRIDI
ncbi:aspartate kinase [Crocinitomicaceae bacterium]|nr:aspartate kinase [Crocinitomicaceae bacterium]MDB4075430.1 aspartate kinase [Crocinitomicaceae bacterium]MDC1283127.1 aspartate kinase [Crocinitomicaceae bacterium]MDC1385147.1 aspartate kinase [Crocinitomicaceae bacterium]